MARVLFVTVMVTALIAGALALDIAQVLAGCSGSGC